MLGRITIDDVRPTTPSGAFPVKAVVGERVTVSADIFNILNQGYVIQRAHRLNRANGDFVREVTSPRIFRLGLRLSFR